jgi:hypothetical protein
MMLIFDHDQLLPPEELARVADASLPLIRRMVARGCPTNNGRLSYSAFAHWATNHYAEVLRDFGVETFPASGHYSESSQFWTLRPVAEWDLHEEDGWLAVGGTGADGILWTLRRGEVGVFAYYPIDREFIWKASDAGSLISGWEGGEIKV